MDWHTLYFGSVTREEIQHAVKNESWQSLRVQLKGLTLEEKYRLLCAYRDRMRRWISEKDTMAWRMVEVRLTNYVTALSRGGLIKPEDYR